MKKQDHLYYKFGFYNGWHKFSYYINCLAGNSNFVLCFVGPLSFLFCYVVDNSGIFNFKEFNIYILAPIVTVFTIILLDLMFLFSRDKGVHLYDDGTVKIKNRCVYCDLRHFAPMTHKFEVRDIVSVAILDDKHFVRTGDAQMPIWNNIDYVMLIVELKGKIAFILDNNEAFVNEIIKRNDKIKIENN